MLFLLVKYNDWIIQYVLKYFADRRPQDQRFSTPHLVADPFLLPVAGLMRSSIVDRRHRVELAAFLRSWQLVLNWSQTPGVFTAR